LIVDGFFLSLFFIIFVKTKNTIYVQFYSKFHSGWAYFFLMYHCGVNALIGFSSKKVHIKDRKIAVCFNSDSYSVFSRYHFIFCFSNGLQMIKAVGMGGLTESRLLALEHPLINIIAITLITIGWSSIKNS
jgi:hypothetical protein